MEARGRGANVAAVARDWLIARGQLFQVVPASTDVGDDRFALPPVGLQYADHQVEHTDFTLFILHAMSSGLDPAPVLRDIARALDAALPYCNLAELATAPLDDATALARTVLIPYFAKHAAAKNVERLVFQFESGARPRFGVWAGPTASKPVRTEATGLGFECMRAVHEMIESSPLGVTTETGTFIHATSAFLVRALLDAAAPALPWEHELDVYLGSIRLGRCDRDGFVPTPIPIAHAQLLLERERTTAGLVRMGFPGIPPTTIDYPVPAAAATRSLRHPDGRRWGVTIRGERLHSTLIEGTEAETFKRPVKTGWELETFVAAQLRAGFVDAGSE